MYYKFHIGKFNGKKTILSKKIVEYGCIVNSEDRLHAELSKLDLTSFELSGKRVFTNAIGCVSLRVTGSECVGEDTLYRIMSDDPSSQSPPLFEPETRSPEASTTQSTKHESKKRKLDASNTALATFLCRHCKQSNDTVHKSCIYCGTPRPGSLVEETTRASQAVAAPAVPASSRTWECRHCTRYNNAVHRSCLYCQCLRSSKSSTASQNNHYARNYQAPYFSQYAYYKDSHQQTIAAPAHTNYPYSYTHQYYQSAQNAMHRSQPSDSTQNTLNSTGHSNTNIVTQPFESEGASEASLLRRERGEGERSAHEGKQTQHPDEGHYKILCTKLTEKLEKQHSKLERRKKDFIEVIEKNAMLQQEVKYRKMEFNEVVEKNSMLEQEVEELRIKVASLEKMLRNQ
jgi:hypothetical protein